jgi:hypothetical protein
MRLIAKAPDQDNSRGPTVVRNKADMVASHQSESMVSEIEFIAKSVANINEFYLLADSQLTNKPST